MSKKTHYPKTSILFHTYYYILKHQIPNFSPYNAIHFYSNYTLVIPTPLLNFKNLFQSLKSKPILLKINTKKHKKFKIPIKIKMEEKRNSQYMKINFVGYDVGEKDQCITA